MDVTGLTATLLSLALAGTGQTIRVPDDLPTIQGAIEAAEDGDEILVAPGIFYETIDLLGKAVTLRSSDGAEITVIDASSLESSVVICVSGEEADSVIHGFTITGGTGTPALPNRVGGGIFIDGGSPTIIDCIFIANTAEGGGGMFNHEASPRVIRCVFRSNEALWAGGVGNHNSDAVFIECAFDGNSAQTGGGMYNGEGQPFLTGCTFTANHAVDGGALYNIGSRPVLSNCTLAGNTAIHGGAVSNVYGAQPRFTACAIAGNTAVFGGGVFNTFYSSQGLRECELSGNVAAVRGGAVLNTISGELIVNGSRFCRNEPGHITGSFTDGGGNEFLDRCLSGCSADIDGSGVVDMIDLVLLLGAWGPCADDGSCDADLDGNGSVDLPDLLRLLAAWGGC